MALQFVASVRTFRAQHNPTLDVRLRVGVHSGPVVAGVVGEWAGRVSGGGGEVGEWGGGCGGCGLRSG